MKPIETIYNGYKFRSRLEARWAVFFDQLGIKYEYEKEGYVLNSGACYLPDFWLPEISIRSTVLGKGTWLEIKPGNISTDEKDSQLYDSFVKEGRCGLILAKGSPEIVLGGDGGNNVLDQYLHCKDLNEIDTWWDSPMLLCKCMNCGQFKFEFMEGNYMYCEGCNADCYPEHPEIEIAILTAKQARFGKKGIS